MPCRERDSQSASVLAFDLGGSGFRAALIGRDGTVSACHRIDEGVADETDPLRWWRAVERLSALVADEAGPAFALVAAVCVTGATRTQVLLDRDGAPLRPAIGFADVRAAELVEALPPLRHPEAAQLSAFHPAARLLWTARHDPGVFERAAAVVDPKDYVAACLTGRVCTDPVSGARLLAAGQPPGASLLDMLGLPSDVVPPTEAPGRMIDTVRAGLDGALGRLAGRAVAMAAHDSWAAALGMGALEDGAAYNLSGTTEVLGVLSRKQAEAKGLVSLDWGGDLHQLGGPSNAGGGTLAWLAGLLAPGEPVGDALDRMLVTPRDRQPLLFLPYLDGERTPHWDPALRGAFLGLGARHGKEDLAWAALEGVACLNRIVLERAEAALGRVASVRFGGGGAASAVWAQVKADMLDRQILTLCEKEAGLLGAGIAAWVALGAWPSLQVAQRAMVRTARVFDPAPARRDFYDRLFTAYLAAEGAVAPVSRTLAAMA